MNHRIINMEQYKRRGQFEYFQSMSYPYVGMTVQVDITKFMKDRKSNNLPFFLTMLYAVVAAANAVPEFRQRIIENEIVEYDYCIPSYTLALEDESYCYCQADVSLDFAAYIKDAKRRQEEARTRSSLREESDINELFFVSSLPWINYTSIVQPVPSPADSNPRITWGKYTKVNDQIQMPVSVLTNHALMDGLHITKFYKELQKKLEETSWMNQS